MPFQYEQERIQANLKKQEEITRAVLEERERDAANRKAEREARAMKKDNEVKNGDSGRPKYE